MSRFSSGKLHAGPAPSSRLATGMGPVSQISTQSLAMLGNVAPPSGDFSMQLLHDLGIDAANITNQVFIANVRLSLYRFGSLIYILITVSRYLPQILVLVEHWIGCVSEITFDLSISHNDSP